MFVCTCTWLLTDTQVFYLYKNVHQQLRYLDKFIMHRFALSSVMIILSENIKLTNSRTIIVFTFFRQVTRRGGSLCNIYVITIQVRERQRDGENNSYNNRQVFA